MPKHHHMWTLSREVTKLGVFYRFWICHSPGCPKPDKITIGRNSRP